MTDKRKKSVTKQDITKLTTAQKLEAIGEDVIFARIADCEFIKVIAASYDVSLTRFHAWLDARPELYARARERQADKMADDMMAIVDEPPLITASGSIDSGDVAHKRLRMDARKWLAGKMAPKKYGDRIAVAGSDSEPLNVNQTFDVSGLSTEVLAQILAAKDAAKRS